MENKYGSVSDTIAREPRKKATQLLYSACDTRYLRVKYRGTIGRYKAKKV